jgi:hypothetical protein
MYFFKVFLLVQFLFFNGFLNGQIPISKGHAHNDYKHKRPLFTAIENGFCSIEVDVFLFNGEVRVAHTALGLPFSSTLEELYLDPLSDLLEHSSAGIYGDSTVLVLMIDLKNKPHDLIPKLEGVLSAYENLLVHGDLENTYWAPIQVVLSGNPPMEFIRNQASGFMFADCPLKKVYNESDECVYCVRRSASWSTFFTWNGKGAMKESEQVLLKNLVFEAKRRGQKVRFWAIPETKVCWELLLNYDVDWINVDDLEEFALFYKEIQ